MTVNATNDSQSAGTKKPEPASNAPSLSADLSDTAAAEHRDNIAAIVGSATSLLSGSLDSTLYRDLIQKHRDACDAAFRDNSPIRELIISRAALIDEVLRIAWQQFVPAEQPYACLVAVGGYGRGELHPYSDIDLLVLLHRANVIPKDYNIGGFITFLWDIGLEIGHSVRSIQQCRSAAKGDLTIVTNLMESRLVYGSERLFDTMRKRVGPDKIWPDSDFFRSKWAEQEERHSRFANSEYNLEPNVKKSPGGLRDIQTIGWITKRHFAADDISMLVPRGVLTDEEFTQLQNGEEFLWRVRYGLHMLSERSEDRLLFDHQRELATIFGYADDDQVLAVEKLMQVYYRWAMILNGLNDMLIQLFDDAIIRACEPDNIREINNRFRVRNGYIEATNSRVFEKTPSALIEIFQILARRESIEGVHANTVRLIRQSLDLIDDSFRADRKIHKRFIELLRANNKVARQLRRMNRYGVLGRYIPAFGKIVGKMQHDLFHIYTVDAHTLEVIRFMRRFAYEDESKVYPLAAQIVGQLPKIELLYLAGLFHDIAKGRGGDHSTLGAVDAYEFCVSIDLPEEDCKLVSWLVGKHLLMSAIAQRQDLQDPAVIYKFATEVQNQSYLDYLYVLTVADINATNSKLWNSWRASLMRQLYHETKHALRRGLEYPTDREKSISDTKTAVIAILASKGISVEQATHIWGEANDEYFLRESANDIVWHTESIVAHGDSKAPLIAIKGSAEVAEDGATQIFIYTPDEELLFAVTTTVLELLELNVQAARIFTSADNYTLDTFVVLDENGQPLGDDLARINEIQDSLTEHLSDRAAFSEKVQRRTPRQLKLFSIPTKVVISHDLEKQHTLIEVTTPDRPGLLARLGRIFYEYDLKLINAKINTLGERVEDVFYVTTNEDKAIVNAALCKKIRYEICDQLDEEAQKHLK